MKKIQNAIKNGQKRGWAAGFLFLLLQSAAVLYGMQAVYRPVGALLAAAAATLLFLKKHWWAVTALPSVCMTAFLMRFRPTGYKYVAVVVAGVLALLTVLRFGGRKLRRVTGALALAGVVLLAGLEIPVIRAARTDENPGRDYLIVLGAAVYGDKPSVSLENRLKSAYEYLGAYPESKAVLSGGAGAGEDISEAECMRRYLTDRGVSSDRLILEEHSFSTYENLMNSRALIEADGGDLKSVAVVSNTYHLCRAKKIAGALGMEAAGVAGIPGLPLYMWGMYLREAVGLVHFWIFGN